MQFAQLSFVGTGKNSKFNTVGYLFLYTLIKQCKDALDYSHERLFPPYMHSCQTFRGWLGGVLHDKLQSGTEFRCKINQTEHIMKKGETENNEGKRQESRRGADWPRHWEQGGANEGKEEQVLPCYKSGGGSTNITEVL